MAKTTTKTTNAVKFIPALFNLTLLLLVVDALKQQAPNESWQNAAAKAYEKLKLVPSRLVDNRLIVASDSGNVYAANLESCQCAAFLNSDPLAVGCWHRAAFAIVKRYNEVTAALDRPVVSNF